MANRSQKNRLKIFISYAWENKELVRQLEAELKAAGAKVRVDYNIISSGDNLIKRISDALEWCNLLLLIWSDAARKSDWVELEWTNAVYLKRKIIPCLLDETPLPAILSSKAHVEFYDIDHGIAKLLDALNLVRQSIILTPNDDMKQVSDVLDNELINASRKGMSSKTVNINAGSMTSTPIGQVKS